MGDHELVALWKVREFIVAAAEAPKALSKATTKDRRKDATVNQYTATFDKLAALFESSIQGKQLAYQIRGI